MQALSDWPLLDRQRLIGVFTDIDDTLTTQGAITPDALQALSDLKAAGLHVIPITGRPIGWCEPFSRGDVATGIAPWPVDAIVAENGSAAFYMRPIGPPSLSTVGEQPSKLYQQDAATRSTNFLRMQQVVDRVVREVPGTRISLDSPGRETDIAIDHSEFVSLSSEDIARVVQVMQSAGMTATVSSIHINGWFGSHNKLGGARWIVDQLWRRSLEAEIERWAYVGDSTNDQLMFEHFPHSIGVANIRRFEKQLRHFPRYVTRGERGAGFAEVARLILQARIL